MDWEKHFKGYNEKELKVISKFIWMNPQGIDGVIKMSKKKDFKPFVQKAAKKGLGESLTIKESVNEISDSTNLWDPNGPEDRQVILKALKKDRKIMKVLGSKPYWDDVDLVSPDHDDETIATLRRNMKLKDLKKSILKFGKTVESITINGKKYKRLNENDQSWAKYYSWRNDKSMTPKQKIGMSMREVRDSLQELERIVNRSIKLKKELKVGTDNYWKSTHSALRRIHERLVKLTGKIANLY
jgi:hypothetical protein